MDAPTASPTPTDPQPPAAINPEVQRLLEAGKAKQAVELAKELHKKAKSSQTEYQLVLAYLARIEQFQSKGMAQEGQTLIALVSERFPSHKNLLGRLNVRALLEAGRYEQLLAPLASSATPAIDKQFIENLLRQHLVDLPALASCGALPVDHPLRVSASAIWKAFEAVTLGAVTDDAIALPMVSHRSPLAGWKLLIRAIAAFYRGDDDAARRALGAIPADAAVQRLAVPLRAMIDHTTPPVGVAGALCKRIAGEEKSLEATLKRIDDVLNFEYRDGLTHVIRHALQLCSAQQPELFDTLRQRIISACVAVDAMDEDLTAELGQVALDAAYWKLLARASMGRAFPPTAAAYWERFYVHGVHERLFAADGLEAAAIWLRIAELTSLVAIDSFNEDELAFELLVAPYDEFDRPAEIVALRPPGLSTYLKTVLDPLVAFERAARLNPSTDVFKKWWALAQGRRLKTKQRERILEQWTTHRPSDSQPLVSLALMAEERRALALAMKRINAAEKVDPLNPLVRQARVRLLLNLTWRHFHELKFDTIEADLQQLGKLPAMREGDRSAVVACIYAMWHLLAGRAAESQEREQAAIAQLGPASQQLVMFAVRGRCLIDRPKLPLLPPLPTLPPPLELAQAVARFVKLAQDLELPVTWPALWSKHLFKVVRQRPCPLSDAECLLIGEGAIAYPDWDLAYIASAAALSRNESSMATAKALLLRARSLAKTPHKQRLTQCLRAALQLARTTHDEKLIESIMSVFDRADERFGANPFGTLREKGSISEELLLKVLSNERKADIFPQSLNHDRFVVRELLRSPLNAIFQNPFSGAFDQDEDEDEPDDPFGASEDLAVLPSTDLVTWEAVLPQHLPLPTEVRATLISKLEQRGLTPEKVMRNPEVLLTAITEVLAEEAGNGSIDPAPDPADNFLPGLDEQSSRGKKRRRK